MLCEDISAEIENRLKRNENLFYVEPVTVSSTDGLSIIRRKKYFGIKKNNTILIEPMYDNIFLFSENWADVTIKGVHNLLNIAQGKFVSDFQYSSLDISYHTCIMKSFEDSNINSVYDLKRDTFIIENGTYEEYNLKHASTEYLWARRGKFYDFIHRESGRIISLPGIEFAYDTSEGMIALSEKEKVCCFNESGLEDVQLLRRIVSDSGGYLVLHNFTYNIQHIIDIYGNILNL